MKLTRKIKRVQDELKAKVEAKFVKKGNGVEFHFVKIEHPSGNKTNHALLLRRNL